MKVKQYNLAELCNFVKGTSATLRTAPGPYPLVVTADFRRSSDSWQIEGPAVCIPLVSSTGHGDASLHRVHYQEGRFALANLLVALLPKVQTICSAKYLYHLLMAQKDQLLVPLMLGTANVSLKEKDIAGVEVTLPPLAEQQRIVTRIEELASQIEEARTLRKQTVKEVEVLWNTSLRQRRLSLLGSSHPKSSLGSLTKVTSGGTPSRENPTFWSGNIPWIKTGELIDGDISKAEEYITQNGVDNSSAKVFPKDTVLIALYGQGQTRGRTGRLLIQAATNQACCAVFPNPELFYTRYIQYWLRSLYVDLREECQGGAQPNWNGALIKNLVIALPPLSEQRCIIEELDSLQAQVDSLKQLQTETAAELDALLPALLDRAFKGEL